MYSIVRLYSLEKNEINRFLNKFFNQNNEYSNLLEWEKKYQNPIEMVDIMVLLLIIMINIQLKCGLV